MQSRLPLSYQVFDERVPFPRPDDLPVVHVSLLLWEMTTEVSGTGSPPDVVQVSQRTVR